MKLRKYDVNFKWLLLIFIMNVNTPLLAAQGDGPDQPIKIYMEGWKSRNGIAYFFHGGKNNILKNNKDDKWYSFIRDNNEIKVGQKFNIYKTTAKRPELPTPGALLGEIEVLQINTADVKAEFITEIDESESDRFVVMSQEMGKSPFTFEVDNSFGQEHIIKEKGLISRSKSAIKKMKISIHGAMNDRPLKHSYKIKVKTHLVAEHNCTAKRKTSYKAKGCSTVYENRVISTDEITLTRGNNWSSTFKIDAEVALFAVKEDPVARYETELLKLEIKPKVVSIEAI